MLYWQAATTPLEERYVKVKKLSKTKLKNKKYLQQNLPDYLSDFRVF